MGIFHFVASAGRVLGLGRHHVQDASQPVPRAPSGSIILNEFKKLGLAQLHGLNVNVEGRTATLSGHVANAKARDEAILAVGNIAGIAAVDAQITTPEPAPAPVLHTVQEGETLSTIAEQYPARVTEDAVRAVNNPVLGDESEPLAGQVLKVPPQA